MLTLYSHFTSTDILKKVFSQFFSPSSTPAIVLQNNEATIELRGEKKFLRAAEPGITLNIKWRAEPGISLKDSPDPFVKQLLGMTRFVQQLPVQNKDNQEKLLRLIAITNMAIGVVAPDGISARHKDLLKLLGKELNAFFFSNPGVLFDVPSGAQGFVYHTGDLILDMAGKCGNADIQVLAESKYLDTAKSATPAQLERKSRSETLLKEKNIPVNIHLPVAEDDEAVILRTPREIAERALALCAVAVKGEGLEQEHLEDFIKRYSIQDLFSPDEKVFIETWPPSQDDRVWSTWRYESFWVLLWAMGYIETLEFPDHICDPATAVQIIFPRTRAQFLEQAKPRSASEILDALDLIYRLHWAAVNARIKNQPPPAGVEPGVIYERHYALNWLTCFDSADWDDVQTHT